MADFRFYFQTVTILLEPNVDFRNYSKIVEVWAYYEELKISVPEKCLS